MPIPTRSQIFASGLLSLCLVANGCGPPPNVTVVGTVLRDGKPIPLSKNGIIEITLKPDVPPDKEFTTKMGRCDPSGKFEVLDVPPGPYIVGIRQLDPDPMTDKLGDKLSYNNSKIKREVDGKTPVVIDLAKPE
jgi:hypothetical protein